jgi:glycosyltransferase involved in cell wall biosynthesis
MELVQPPKKQRNKLIVACIPAYNEDCTIASTIMKTQKYVDKVIVYDDGSKDQTKELAALLDTDIISEKENKGKGYAMRRMFQEALDIGADAVVTLDSDGQHNPNEIPTVIEPILNGEADVVLGSRFVDGGSTDAPLYRKFGLKIINSISKGGNKYNVKDTQNGFRAYSREALGAMLECKSDGFGIETEELSIAAKHGLRIKEVPVNVRYQNLAKPSSRNPFRQGINLVEKALQLVVEKRPLLLLGLPGAALLCIGLVAGVMLLWEFNLSRSFSMPYAIIALGGLITGIFLIMTTLILYGIRSMYNDSKK